MKRSPDSCVSAGTVKVTQFLSQDIPSQAYSIECELF